MLRNSFIKKRADNLLLLMILAVVVLTMSLLKKNFFSYGTFQSIAFQLPEMGILAMAMMITMISGGINLSTIASANLAGIVIAKILTTGIPAGYDSPSIVCAAVLLGIVICTAVGTLNGLIIAYFNVPAILATLAMQMLVNGLCLIITHGAVISGFSPSFSYLGNGMLLGIPVPLYIFILCALFLSLILHRKQLGSQIYLFGSNPVATAFSGVNAKTLLIKTYSLSGLFAGVAAIILTSRFNSAAAGYAESYLLQSVLVAVLGGVNPLGGSGRISGLVLAVLILQVVASGLNLIRVSQYLTVAIWGLILLAAVVLRSKKF